jgi:hypothetical protein
LKSGNLKNQPLEQGDQIGRIFTHWLIVYFGQVLLTANVAHTFGLPTYFYSYICINFGKNGFGCILDVFSRTHLVTLL